MRSAQQVVWEFLAHQQFARGVVAAIDGEDPSSSVVLHVSDGETTSEMRACCAVVDTLVSDNFSSGVLIADRLVLTASHSAPPQCFVRAPAETFLSGPRTEVRSVVRANAPGTRAPDLALLILESPIAGVEPSRLATADQFEDARASGVFLCGFGFTRDAFGNPSGAGIKRRSRSPIPFDPPGPGTGPVRVLPDLEFVAGGETNGIIHDAEVGDSGGGGFLTQDDTVVVGIVSRNAAGHKSVFTRVDANTEWIREVATAHGIAIPG